jgi:predicted DNA-binding protein
MVCISVYIDAMKRTNLHLKDEQLKRLRALSDKTGAPVAELVRRAIEAYLKQHRA